MAGQSHRDERRRQQVTEYLTDVFEASKSYLNPVHQLHGSCQEISQILANQGFNGPTSRHWQAIDRLLTAVTNCHQRCINCVDLERLQGTPGTNGAAAASVDSASVSAAAAAADNDDDDPIDQDLRDSNTRSDCITKAREFKKAYGDLLSAIGHWRETAASLSPDLLGSEFLGGRRIGAPLAGTAAVGIAYGGIVVMKCKPGIMIWPMVGLIFCAVASMVGLMWWLDSRNYQHYQHYQHSTVNGVFQLMELAGRLNSQLDQFKPLTIRHARS